MNATVVVFTIPAGDFPAGTTFGLIVQTSFRAGLPDETANLPRASDIARFNTSSRIGSQPRGVQACFSVDANSIAGFSSSDFCVAYLNTTFGKFQCASNVTVGVDGSYCGTVDEAGQYSVLRKTTVTGAGPTSAAASNSASGTPSRSPTPTISITPTGTPVGPTILRVFVSVDAPTPVKVPVDTPVNVPIPNPVPNPVNVPFNVPVPVNVPFNVPVPVNVNVPVPVPVDVPVPINVPVTVPVPVPNPVPNPVPAPVPNGNNGNGRSGASSLVASAALLLTAAAQLI